MKPNQGNRTSSNKKQKDFLNRIYEEGEKTEAKANRENVAKATRNATK